MDEPKQQSSISNEQTLNHEDNLLFTDIKFFIAKCNNIEDVKRLLTGQGATHINYLTERVTHVISDYDCPEAEEAVDLFDKPVVNSLWIRMCLKAGKLLPTVAFSPQRIIFQDKIISFSSELSSHDIEVLAATLTYFGATVTKNRNLSTHIIAASANDPILSDTSNKLDVKIVAPDWAIDCISQNRLCDELSYDPKLLLPPPSPEPVPEPSPLPKIQPMTDEPTTVNDEKQQPNDKQFLKERETNQDQTNSHKDPQAQLSPSLNRIPNTNELQNPRARMPNNIRVPQPKFRPILPPNNMPIVQRPPLHQTRLISQDPQQPKKVIVNYGQYRKPSPNQNNVDYVQQTGQSLQHQAMMNPHMRHSMTNQHSIATHPVQPPNMLITNQPMNQQIPNHNPSLMHPNQHVHQPIQHLGQVQQQSPIQHQTVVHRQAYPHQQVLMNSQAQTHQQIVSGQANQRMQIPHDHQPRQQIQGNHSQQIQQPQMMQTQQHVYQVPPSHHNSQLKQQMPSTQPSGNIVQTRMVQPNMFNQVRPGPHPFSHVPHRGPHPQNSQQIINRFHDPGFPNHPQSNLPRSNQVYYSHNSNQHPQIKQEQHMPPKQAGPSQPNYPINPQPVQFQPNVKLDHDNAAIHQDIATSNCSIQPNTRQISGDHMINQAEPIPSIFEAVKTKNLQLNQDPQYHLFETELTKPVDKPFYGCKFSMVDYDDPLHQQKLTKAIKAAGGTFEDSIDKSTHLICDNQLSDQYKLALEKNVRCVTIYWINDVLAKNKLMVPWRALHLPIAFSRAHKPLCNEMIAITNLSDSIRGHVKEMILRTGARYTATFSPSNTVLICGDVGREKYERALEWRTPMAGCHLLTDYLLNPNCDFKIMLAESKYQAFKKDQPLKITSYNVVQHIMKPWERPIKCDNTLVCDRPLSNGECKSPRNSLNSTDSGIATSGSNLSDESNVNKNDLNDKIPKIDENLAITALKQDLSEIRSELPIRESDQPIRLLFTHLDPNVSDMLISIAAKFDIPVTDNPRECTHLIVDRISRTPKFICAFNSAKFILSHKWLIESSKRGQILQEQSFILHDEEGEKKYCFNLAYSLLKRRKFDGQLFKDLIFFVTPSVCPSLRSIREMIESAGGTVVTRKRPSYIQIKQMKMDGRTFIVISCQEDQYLCSSLAKSGVEIVDTEFVMSGILRQDINFEAHRLNFLCENEANDKILPPELKRSRQ